MTQQKEYRHTSLYGALLYCTSLILHFLQTEGFGQSCVEQIIGTIFSNRILTIADILRCRKKEKLSEAQNHPLSTGFDIAIM